MSAVDLNKVRPGDEVLVRAKFQLSATGSRSTVQIDQGTGLASIYVNNTAIVRHTPKALEVGDRAYVANPNAYAAGTFGKVIAVDDGKVWLHHDHIGHTTYRLVDLERAS